MEQLLIALMMLFGGAFWPDPGSAQTSVAADPSGLIGDCAETCHLWLIEDPARAVTLDVPTTSVGRTRRVRYAADWIYGEPCPRGRVDIAYKITRGHPAAFLPPLFDKGFCPRATLDG